MFLLCVAGCLRPCPLGNKPIYQLIPNCLQFGSGQCTLAVGPRQRELLLSRQSDFVA